MRKIIFDAIYKPTMEHIIPLNIDFNNNTITFNMGTKDNDWCYFSYDGTYGDAILRQFIGINDINKKPIHEGDIIKITYDTNWSEDPFYIGEVKYLDTEDYPAFDLRPWIDCEMNALSWLKSESDPSVIYYEVIGNIYENPELLECK